MITIVDNDNHKHCTCSCGANFEAIDTIDNAICCPNCHTWYDVTTAEELKGKELSNG